MSALSSALDHIQLGENNTLEWSWSENTKELLTQFNFQLTRTSDITNLEVKYQDILRKVFIPTFNKTSRSNELVKCLYKLIGYTRDIVSGKGEYNLSYMLISGLYKFSQSQDCPDNERTKITCMATSALESLVRTTRNEHPYGSWKDLKYFCNYHIKVEDRSEDKLNQLNDPLFNKALDLICGQLRCDENAPVKTLVAKWIPREKSAKFGWITIMLAQRYYSTWITKNLTPTQHCAARRKCFTHFRQLVSNINKNLNTPQINQCNGTWSKINFDKNVSSITLRKQGKAFQSVKKNGQLRPTNDDRQQCKTNYEEYIERCKTGKSVAKGQRVSIIDFVKDAIHATTTSNTPNCVEIDSINAQWKNNATQNSKLSNVIAMVDTSGSMENDNCVPLYSAIGLGLRIAEKSKIGKRVLTFSASPEWVNLDNCPDFVSMVAKVQVSPWGANTNFEAALNLILDAAISNNISPKDMNDMVLVILSDMQIDLSRGENTTMFKTMKQKYSDAGLKTTHNTPYKLPHIVFWNLRSTDGFPSLSSTENTTMMSGNNPSLLNAFAEDGLDSLKHLTPWNQLVNVLNHERYNHLENIMDNLWTY
jgi:Mg-chelatase subunit ChlD